MICSRSAVGSGAGAGASADRRRGGGVTRAAPGRLVRGSGNTVRFTRPDLPSAVAVMFTDPGDLASTAPEAGSTPATLSSLLSQAMGRSPRLPSCWSLSSARSVSVSPTLSGRAPSTRTAATVAGTTETGRMADSVPLRAMISAVPGA